MTQIQELTQTQATQLASVLRDGVEALDLGQEVTFQAYARVVLPADGYIFWSPTAAKTVNGSLHFTQEIDQAEDETYGRATAVFTAETRLVDFETMPINTVYVAKVGGFRFAFSQQQGFYQQARLFHYFGNSIAPAFAAQLLDSPGTIDLSRAVTSNSLPLWLALNSYKSPFSDGFNPNVTLYPSFVSPPNLTPAYGTVHIDPDWTDAIQAVPYLDVDRNHWQLATDRVRITLYGLQSDEALDFLDFVEQYSVETDNFGIMNTPIVRDGKRTQPELVALAMQKFIEFKISYYQVRSATVARQLIKSAQPTYIIESSI